MKLTKDKLFERQKELNFYNLMGVMNTSCYYMKHLSLLMLITLTFM